MAAFDISELTKWSPSFCRSIRQRIIAGTALTMLLAIGVPAEKAMAQEDKVLFALSGRHMETTVAQLEQLAGGQDQLVAKLLAYRSKETPPFAAIRSEKLLLNYAARPEVASALEQDVQSPEFKGLAKIVAIHLEQVPDAAARQRLARAVVARAKTEAEFVSLAKQLEKSSDEQVRAVAKTLTE